MGGKHHITFQNRKLVGFSIDCSRYADEARCDDFFDIPFNRKKWVFSAMLDNTFKVNKNLAFELMGNVQTPVIQGTFDIESIFNLTAGLKWSFANDRMSLSARCNDILNAGMPKTKVRFKGQDLDMGVCIKNRLKIYF